MPPHLPKPPEKASPVEVHLVDVHDAALLSSVADGVFDHPVEGRWSAEFLADPRHHLAVALEDGVVVGMASGLHYVHPDKPPELWIAEVGVAPTHRRRGLGRRLVRALFDHARTLGCAEAWVLTEPGNRAARSLYAELGGVEEERPVHVSFDLTRSTD